MQAMASRRTVPDPVDGQEVATGDDCCSWRRYSQDELSGPAANPQVDLGYRLRSDGLLLAMSANRRFPPGRSAPNLTNFRRAIMAGVGADGSTGISRDGLRASEVAQRAREGRVNGTPPRSTRSVIAILRANALTRFNLLLVGLFGATLAVRASKDTLFIWVVVLNLVVGVAQELRARRTLDRLNVLDTVPVRVRRDGEEQHVPPELRRWRTSHGRA